MKEIIIDSCPEVGKPGPHDLEFEIFKDSIYIYHKCTRYSPIKAMSVEKFESGKWYGPTCRHCKVHISRKHVKSAFLSSNLRNFKSGKSNRIKVNTFGHVLNHTYNKLCMEYIEKGTALTPLCAKLKGLTAK
jgi:hypothetical protein